MKDKRTIVYVTLELALLIVCFAFYGCKAHATPPSSAGNIDPCGLLTKEEVAAATGDDVNVTPKPEDNACAYDLLQTGSEKSRGATVVVVFRPGSPQFARFGLTSDDRTEAKPISGLGDKAVLFSSKASPDAGPKAIQVMKGEHRIAVGVSATVSVDTLTSLAAKAISRLP